MSSHANIRRIGILGGTFDPIHIGHLLMAERVREELDLEEIWFMPSHIPPHKQNRPISNGEDRIKMIQLAIEEIPEYKVSTVEFEREQLSFTYDTMQLLKDLHPHVQFYFIIGGDMVESLQTWHRYTELLQQVQFVALRRPGFSMPRSKDWIQHLIFVDMPQLEISSTEIRTRSAQGRSIRFMVPEAVRTYIKEQRLYVE